MKKSRSGTCPICLATVLVILLSLSLHAVAQTPSPALLVLEKSDSTLAIVDPATLKVVARIPAGPDPHEVIASDDGKLAYISNYGGEGSALNTISVIDLVAAKPLPAIDLGALHSPHGLAFAGGKLYFTAETSKAIGRYDPATQRVDWILGTGQDRTHMIAVSKSLDQIVTSNVSSGTISILEQVGRTNGGYGPPPSANGPDGALAHPPPPPRGNAVPRKTWEVTNVAAGRGSEGFDVSPDGKEIWVANAQDGTATIIDLASKKVTATVAIGVKGANRLKFTPDGKQVLISGLGSRGDDSTSGGDLEVLDAVSRKSIKLLQLGGGSAGILIPPTGDRAYVAVSAKGNIAVVDLKTLEVVARISAGNQPDGMAWAVGK
jgi:YVTN family beta-propeller protein